MPKFVQCTLASNGEPVFINLENVGGLNAVPKVGTMVTFSGQTDHTYIVKEAPKQIISAPEVY